MKYSWCGIKLLLSVMAFFSLAFPQWYLPVNYATCDIDSVRLSDIGSFGVVRKARPTVPGHYHTGIDILRPGPNYQNEPVFPAYRGTITSVIDDGPYSQIIIEHQTENGRVWTVYEHVHVLPRAVGSSVTPFDTIAYFFNKRELNRHGWQFDHVHFEINRTPLLKVVPVKGLPDRHLKTYGIICYSKKELFERLENPKEFLRDKLSRRN